MNSIWALLWSNWSHFDNFKTCHIEMYIMEGVFKGSDLDSSTKIEKIGYCELLFEHLECCILLAWRCWKRMGYSKDDLNRMGAEENDFFWLGGGAVWDEDSMPTTPRLTSRPTSIILFFLGHRHTPGLRHLRNTEYPIVATQAYMLWMLFSILRSVTHENIESWAPAEARNSCRGPGSILATMAVFIFGPVIFLHLVSNRWRHRLGHFFFERRKVFSLA